MMALVYVVFFVYCTIVWRVVSAHVLPHLAFISIRCVVGSGQRHQSRLGLASSSFIDNQLYHNETMSNVILFNINLAKQRSKIYSNSQHDAICPNAAFLSLMYSSASISK